MMAGNKLMATNINVVEALMLGKISNLKSPIRPAVDENPLLNILP